MPQAASPNQVYVEESAEDSPENDNYEPPEVVSPDARRYSLPPEYRPVPVAPNISSRMWAELKDFIGPGGGPMPDAASRYGAPQPGDAGDQGIPQRTDPGLQYHEYDSTPPGLNKAPPVDSEGSLLNPSEERLQEMMKQFFNAPEQAWEGKSVPTQRDIDTIREQPTDSVLESFEQKFGEGSAGKYLNPGK